VNKNFVPAGGAPVPTDAVINGGPAAVAFGDPEAGRESVIRHYWRMIWRRRLVILACVLAALAAGIAFSMLTQPRYAAVTTVEIARETTPIVDIEERQQRPAFDPEFYQTQYQLLQSRSLAEMVVRDLRLDRNDAFLTNFKGGGDLPQSREQRERIAVGIVMGNTDIVPVRLSSVVQIRHTSPDPATAAAISNSLAENFIEATLARRFEATRYAREFLQNRLGEVRQRLEDSERQAVAYAGQNEIINVAPTSTGSQQQGAPQGEQPLAITTLSAANEALAKARTDRITAETRFRAASGSSAELLQSPTLAALRTQRAEAGAQYQRLLSDFGPEYPTVRAARAQLAELDRQIGAETGRIRSTASSGLRDQYEAALASERQLEQLVGQLKGGVIDLRRRSIQYNIFQRDVDTNRALYDALLQRFKEVGVTGGVGANNVSIVDTASVPGAPYSPNFRLNLLLALLGGLLLGVVIAVILEQLEEAAITPQDFQSKLGVPLLGSVPVAAKGDEPLTLLRDPKSPISEAYYSVLTGLAFSTSHGTPTSFLVTSTQPSEGKSTTGFALAQGLARIGKRVLLVDGDMRNPSLHKLFDKPHTTGLSNLLTGDKPLEQLVLPTDIQNLSLMTSGPIPPNPAELLAGNALDRIIAGAAQHFDHVVIDAPPVLGLADAPLLGRSVEAVVFVMEAGRTRTSQAQTALRRMLAVQANVIGAVLTKLDVKRQGYGYGYGYDYGYGR
jgi:polysaccharide biosynthesis transport protein